MKKKKWFKWSQMKKRELAFSSGVKVYYVNIYVLYCFDCWSCVAAWKSQNAQTTCVYVKKKAKGINWYYSNKKRMKVPITKQSSLICNDPEINTYTILYTLYMKTIKERNKIRKQSLCILIFFAKYFFQHFKLNLNTRTRVRFIKWPAFDWKFVFHFKSHLRTSWLTEIAIFNRSIVKLFILIVK